jgi:hypothetical protein
MDVQEIISALPQLTSSELRQVRHALRDIRRSRRTRHHRLTVEQKLEMSLDDIIQRQRAMTKQ